MASSLSTFSRHPHQNERLVVFSFSIIAFSIGRLATDRKKIPRIRSSSPLFHFGVSAETHRERERNGEDGGSEIGIPVSLVQILPLDGRQPAPSPPLLRRSEPLQFLIIAAAFLSSSSRCPRFFRYNFFSSLKSSNSFSFVDLEQFLFFLTFLCNSLSPFCSFCFYEIIRY